MTQTAQVTLSEFLLERIAEDEAILRGGEPIPHYTHLSDAVGTFGPRCPTCRGGLWGGKPRALAECEAKRRIVEEHGPFQHEIAAPGVWCRMCFAPSGWPARQGDSGVPYPCSTLRAVALPYADHPGYREEWRI